MTNQWRVKRQSKVTEPLTNQKLNEYAEKGLVLKTDLISNDNGQTWHPATKVKGLFNLVEYKNSMDEIMESLETPIYTPETNKECDFCGETILSKAKKCKHCGELLDPVLRASATPAISQVVNVSNSINDSSQRWSPLVAAFLSFLVPGLGQLYKGQVLNGIAWFFITIFGYLLFIVPGIIIHLCCIVGAASGSK